MDGKTAVVTGSSRGLGKAIAMQLARMGANIVLNGTSDAVYMTAEEFRSQGYKVAVAKGDVRSSESAKAIIDKAVESFGGIDILVNNAGIKRDKLMYQIDDADWDDVINTNLKGAFLCTKHATRHMMKKRNGKIINITSIAGKIGSAGQINYSSSKAGMIGLTKSIAKEFAARGIICNAVAPGAIDTDMTEDLSENIKNNFLHSIPLRRFGTPEDVANVVAFLASDSADYITGQVIGVDGGMDM